MQYRPLGKTGLEVSEIGFGSMSLQEPGDAAADIIAKAVEAGINYFDTADLYNRGKNEIWVGKALKPVRNKVILATKAGNQWREDGSGWDWNPRKNYILKAAEDSLRRLQTDYIDLYQLHGGTIGDPVEETIEAFETLVQQGKIRYYGISSIRPNVIRKYVALSNIQTVMMQYSLLDRRPEEAMLGLLAESNISVMARGALAQGILVDKPAKEYAGLTVPEVDTIKKIVADWHSRGVDATRVALQYVLSHPAVTCAVTGLRTPGQLDNALAALQPVDISLIKELGQVVPADRYKEHR